ncbi:hypothetical protein ACIP98_08690 [Streptomyces sp. NPDC088354]|nr:hypothetical protein [Streptomyces sp. MI02-7b]MDX3074412.1 hypothetical protein [Streptomyces sp. MI02-7b]
MGASTAATSPASPAPSGSRSAGVPAPGATTLVEDPGHDVNT